MAKPGRQRRDIKNRNTGEVVLSAIKKLRRYTGWTARTIVKFIKIEYDITNDPYLSRRVSRALKRGVRLGLLQKDRGRYRLNDTVGRSSVACSLKQQHRRYPRPMRPLRPQRPLRPPRPPRPPRRKEAPLRLASRSRVTSKASKERV